MDTTEEVIDAINGLITVCADGEQGYTLAAEALAEHDGIREQFLQFANERATFASQLKIEVARLGGDPSSGGDLSGALHRGWINLRGKVLDSKPAVVAECQRGEAVALRWYEKALAAELPPQTADLVRRQEKFVRVAHDQVTRLKAQLSA